MTATYINNSNHKDAIRSKWVECIKSKYPSQISDGTISIITLPAEECQDLSLFASEGILCWEETETGAKTITKGNVVCFERSSKIYTKIRTKLTGNCIVNVGEIGKYFEQNYHKIINGQANVFPVDVINLDFDKNISKNDTEIEKILDLIFQFQAKHRKDFSVFITFPQDEPTSDAESFKTKLAEIITSNLSDPINSNFSTEFSRKYTNLSSMDYGSFLIVGINKLFVKKAVNQNFTLIDNQYYIYGEEGRHKMISLILNFGFNASVNTPNLYYQDVVKCLDSIELIRDQNNTNS